MIRTITETEKIPTRIAEVLETDHPRWLEKVLLLVGFYTSPRRAMRTVKITGARAARKRKSAVAARKTTQGKSVRKPHLELKPALA
jgi:hypothetical protein